MIRVVLFSGGRGSGALSEVLATDSRVQLTVAINGYDDGASTGEVRRFLGDSLGPSDFRKNAARLARLRGSCEPELVDLLDVRLPPDAVAATFHEFLRDLELAADALAPTAPRGLDRAPSPPALSAVRTRLLRFEDEYERSGQQLDFGDCSIGNLVFAGAYLSCGRRFNAAVDDYAALAGLPAGLIENVTDGTNAFLAAIDSDGRLLGSEEEIVDARRHNRVADIFLIQRPLTIDEREILPASRSDALVEYLGRLRVEPPINPRLVERLAAAHLIIYAPGTQHSSLFPSYLTPGLNAAIAGNLEATKLLVTNIQSDAEITGRSALDLVERAVFYLREKDRLATPTPCLITHYLLNDPGKAEPERSYVPLGRLESVEDPRLVRVGNYEQGITGRHDAAKILGPFIDTFLARWNRTQKVAVLLQETQSTNKIAQTILEMIRGGIRQLPVEVTVFHGADQPLDREFTERLGFAVNRLVGSDTERDTALRRGLVDGNFDYLVLFESSGMYNGEDIAGLASHLRVGRLDAVWGSRRLSVRDIEESYRLKYRRKALLGTISYVGSHLLSALCLTMYGRYISDTLSGARAIRVSDALAITGPLTHKLVNQRLLTALLRRRAEMLEIPVQFLPISPGRVRRTSVLDGVQAVAEVVAGRFRHRIPPQTPEASGDRHPRRSGAWTGS